MIRKFLRFLFYLVVLAVVGFFFLAGKIADRSKNNIEDVKDFEISPKAKSLHQSLMVADLHADNLLWDRDPLTDAGHSQVDIPKLIEGNYAIQVFDAVIKTPKNLNYTSNNGTTDNIRLLAMANRWPVRSWFSLFDRAIHQSDVLHRAESESSSLEIIKSKNDLTYFLSRRRSNSYIVGGLLSVEGLHALEGELNNVDRLFDAGYRIMGLVHFFDNEVGGSSSGEQQGGLTDFGRRVIRRMNDLQITIDLAHASPNLVNDVIQLSNRPVIVSHTGVKGILDISRNLSDQQIQMISETGGIIGIGFWPEAIGDVHPLTIAKSVRYVADLVGVKHVAFGSDFDGAVTVGFDASQIIYMTEALLQEGFTDEEIRSIMGGNVIEFLKENLPEK